MRAYKRSAVTAIITAIACGVCLFLDKEETPAVEPETVVVETVAREIVIVAPVEPEVIILTPSYTRDIVFEVSSDKPFVITRHSGGKMLDYDDLMNTVIATLNRMPNIEKNLNIANLVMETCITETGMGRSKYRYAAKNYRNYGIAQLREDTVKDTLAWLRMVRKDAYKAVVELMDPKLSLRDNLMYNVPFSIAMCAQYYWRREVNLPNLVNTVEERAALWKKQYNTSAGLGTVEKYLERVSAVI